jgi:tetratricopeptide (TPR) repeat protein
MPQVPTGAELRFTNHWIGVYDSRNPLVPIRRSTKVLPPLPAGNLRQKLIPPADPSSFRPLFEQVLAKKQSELGGTAPAVARSASDLGLFLKSLGEFQGAIAPLQKALEIDSLNGDVMLAADQENLASVLIELNRVNEALPLIQAASQGRDAAVEARCFSILASIDSANAAAYYMQAIEAQEKASGKDDPRIAMLLNNLALALRAKDDNRSAEPLLRRALAIQEAKLGANHPAVGSTLNNLGSLLQSTGRLDEAERIERRALRIFEQRLGPRTVELATTCTNLADLLWTKRARAEALSLYRRALAVDESIYGPDHPEVAGDLTNQGLLLKEIGERGAAEQMLRRAVAIYEKQFGPGSKEAAQARQNLAGLNR